MFGRSDWFRLGRAWLSGALLAAAFPKIGLPWLAWLAPGLMLWASHGTTGKKVFLAGWFSGLGFYLVSVYWLLLMPFPWHAVAGYLALSTIFSLFVGAWCWTCWRLAPPPRESAFSPSGEGRDGVRRRVPKEKRSAHSRKSVASPPSVLLRSWRLLAWPLLCGLAWVAMEMAIARVVLGGFPYNLLGVSQCRCLPLIQIASVTGVYGVSFLVAWASVALVAVLWQATELARERAGASASGQVASALAPGAGETPALPWAAGAALRLGPPCLAIACAVLFGMQQLARPEDSPRRLKIALIQPVLAQAALWDPNEKTNRLHKLLELSDIGLAAHPNLLVWPEAVLSGVLGRNRFTQETVGNLLRPHGAWLVFGGDDVHPSTTRPGEVEGFNTAFLINPKGELVERYYKRHLVGFGEYMPGARLLPFLARLRSAGAGLLPGEHNVEFQMENPRARFAPLICYEDVFPHEVRRRVTEATDFLLNLTNDGWFGRSASQWQHAQTALFRAIENGLPLVRCANNGLTCWIDARGRVHDTYFPGSKDIYGPGCKIVEVPLRSSGSNCRATFYNRHGDWFGWGCVGLTIAAGVSILRRRASRNLAAMI